MRSTAPWLSEFTASAIDPAVALANIEFLSGPAALEAFLEGTIAARQKNTSYLSSENARLMRHYEFLEAGAWFARSAYPGAAYCKPSQPRTVEGKPIKYESPPGQGSDPIFPPSLGPAGASWEAILADPSIAVALTEGAKKSLALISHGLPAVGLRGVYSWRSGKGSRELHPRLAALAAGGRKIYVVFDNDSKVKTARDVSAQGFRLGSALEAAGGAVRFLQWDISEGKGVDDVLAGLPSEARAAWLRRTLERATDLKQWRRRATVQRARAVLATTPPRAIRETCGGYLPELPALLPGTLHWLDASMGSGKTHRMGSDWVGPWVAAGGLAVVLSPLNSLGMQTARHWDLPHVHEYSQGGADRRALEADISVRGGIVACVNSAHRILELIPKDRPLLLVIDEAAQTLSDAVGGGTLKRNWAARWEDLIELAQRAAGGGAIAIAEDSLGADTIELVRSLSGSTTTVGIRHKREADTWPVRVSRATPLSEWRGDLLAALQAGDRILYVTTSQAEGRRLERAALAAGVSAARIDSETNESGAYREFFESPETWLYREMPQLLILSPSGKTGLSIEGGITRAGAYFDSVWGYFPSLDTDTAMQLLGRYRPGVARYIWAPAYIQPEFNEKCSALATTHELENEAARYARAGGFGQAAQNPHDTAIRHFLGLRGTRRWAQKIQAGDALINRLEAAGHAVSVATEGVANDAVKQQWDAIREALAREDSAAIAALELDPDIHTLEWAYQLQSKESTREQRLRASKVLTSARFPGLNWNCPELWYQAEFGPQPLARGAALWAEADHFQALWQRDAKEASTVLAHRLRAAHLLPQNGPKAALAAQFKPLLEKLLAVGEVSPGGAVEADIKALALRLSSEIRRYWRLSITESQSAVEVTNKVAAKFGLAAGGVANRLRKVAMPSGRRQWVYRIVASETWQSLVNARAWALSQGGTDPFMGSFNRSVPLPAPEIPLGHPPHPPEPSGAAPPRKEAA
jgi:hypothetical protein